MCSSSGQYPDAGLCLEGDVVSCAKLTELFLPFSRGFGLPQGLFLFLQGFCRLRTPCELNLFAVDILILCGGLSFCINSPVFLHLYTFVDVIGLRTAFGGYSQIFFIIPRLFVLVLLLGYLYGFLLNFGLLCT